MSNFARMLFANHLPVDGSCLPSRWPAFCRLFLLEMLAVRFGVSANPPKSCKSPLSAAAGCSGVTA